MKTTTVFGLIAWIPAVILKAYTKYRCFQEANELDKQKLIQTIRSVCFIMWALAVADKLDRDTNP